MQSRLGVDLHAIVSSILNDSTMESIAKFKWQISVGCAGLSLFGLGREDFMLGGMLVLLKTDASISRLFLLICDFFCR